MQMHQAYKFCLRCGGPLDYKTTFLECQKCGYHFYLNAKPVTAVLLYNSENEFLFVKRAIEPRKDTWDFPGGFVDGSENFDEGIIREVKEEVDISIDKNDLEILGTYTDNYPYQDVTVPTLGVAYIAKLPAGAVPKPADDVNDHAYFKLKDFPADDQIAFESLQQMITDLKAKFTDRFS